MFSYNNSKYFLHSQTKNYKKLVERTKKEIYKHLKSYEKIGVAYSTGKDSTVMLHLIYSIFGDKVLPVFYDCSAVWQDSYEHITKIEEHIGLKVNVIKSKYTYWQLRSEELKTGEYNPLSDSYTMQKIVFDNVVESLGLLKYDVCCVATRAEESKSRKNFFKFFPNLRFSKKGNCDTYYPLEYWKKEDIWAYLVTNNIPINNLYFKFQETFGGVPEQYRVDEFLEREAIKFGSLKILKKYYPLQYQKVALEIPFLLDYIINLG
jgi:3'-phosphoadenosine 5'-phosphosulfate sulfotransferase (PAPS reductase)/FAD synthetase